MAAELITIIMTGLDGTPYPTKAWKLENGDVYPVGVSVGPDGQPIAPAADGVDATGISAPTGGSGIRGWLSGIYNVLANAVLKFGQPDVRLTGVALNMATANAAVTIPLANAQGTIAVQIAGLTAAGGSLAIEASNDGGTSWNAKNALVPASEGTIAQSLTADGGIRVNCAGHTHVRLRVSGTGSGNATIGYSASAGQGVVSLGAAIPPGSNTIGKVGIDQATPGTTNGVVINNGSTGLDLSANKPTLPNVGAAFAASGPYASYVLVATVPASATRANVDIENLSGAQIAIVRDDGTAAGGAAPVNASIFSLAGGAAAGQQGGSWASSTFKGRLQIYAASASAQVAVMVD